MIWSQQKVWSFDGYEDPWSFIHDFKQQKASTVFPKDIVLGYCLSKHGHQLASFLDPQEVLLEEWTAATMYC